MKRGHNNTNVVNINVKEVGLLRAIYRVELGLGYRNEKEKGETI